MPFDYRAPFAAAAAFATLVSYSCTGETSDTSTATTPEQTSTEAPATSVEVTPLSHATFVLTSADGVVYNDPVGGVEAFAGQPVADLILVSDIHGDHLDTATLGAILRDPAHADAETQVVVPAAVQARLPPALAARVRVMANGESATVAGIGVEALPMYNLREKALEFHVKGRGNGYLLDFGGERVYIAGDTEDIAEMRSLEDVDRAFVPMNLPYTMPVSAAADAVLAFRPAIVHPYHYRGTEGLSDVGAFAKTVDSAGVAVEVVQLDWYPERG